MASSKKVYRYRDREVVGKGDFHIVPEKPLFR
jgi:hypothetical protein